MSTSISIPPSYCLIKKDRLSLLLKEEYRDLLLQEGIEDFDIFLKKHARPALHLKGRTPHFSVPLREGRVMVVRRYSHGGWLRFLSRDLYLTGSRSFEELTLTEEIRSSGIPTIEPIGAIHQPVYAFLYRAYLLSREIHDVEDLPRYFSKLSSSPDPKGLIQKRKQVRSIGALIQKFHDRGFFHRDLQLKNILVSDEKSFLIDFDRSYRKEALTSEERIENILRLNRSVEKWKRFDLSVTRTDRWRFFMAYSGGDPKLRKALRRALRSHSILLFLHRFIWSLGEVIKGPRVKGSVRNKNEQKA